jgi:hypothetical protein
VITEEGLAPGSLRSERDTEIDTATSVGAGAGEREPERPRRAGGRERTHISLQSPRGPRARGERGRGSHRGRLSEPRRRLSPPRASRVAVLGLGVVLASITAVTALRDHEPGQTPIPDGRRSADAAVGRQTDQRRVVGKRSREASRQTKGKLREGRQRPTPLPPRADAPETAEVAGVPASGAVSPPSAAVASASPPAPGLRTESFDFER